MTWFGKTILVLFSLLAGFLVAGAWATTWGQNDGISLAIKIPADLILTAVYIAAVVATVLDWRRGDL